RQLFHMTAGDLPSLSPVLTQPNDGDRRDPSHPTVIPVRADMPVETQSAASLDDSIESARTALLADQQPDGHWRYECEADCTIPAEYILLAHFADEVVPVSQARIARFIRTQQGAHGGCALYYGGDFEISCSVKAYYALKLAGDDENAPHMV